jgi:predicted transcriptional regulator
MDEKIVELLEDIRKLLVASLIAKGVQGKDIADVLGVDKSVITRIASAKKIRKGMAAANS